MWYIRGVMKNPNNINPKGITLPHVNLNGTGARTLLEDYTNARDKIMEAIEAMNRIEFHSRDYMQQQDGKAIWQKAVAEQEARFAALQSISDDFGTIQIHVSNFC